MNSYSEMFVKQHIGVSPLIQWSNIILPQLHTCASSIKCWEMGKIASTFNGRGTCKQLGYKIMFDQWSNMIRQAMTEHVTKYNIFEEKWFRDRCCHRL